MAVWSLANQETFREVGNLFGMNRGNVHHCIFEVFKATAHYLKPMYIKWPTLRESNKIAADFEEKYGFPGVIGCVDGTHIGIRAPANDRDSYINRKGYPSVNVLAVCDHQKLFTYVYADRAGSVHDARVLRVSSLGQKLEICQIGGADDKYHILGDSAFPLLPNLLVPYRDNGHLTPAQITFNTIHSSARSIIERAFGRLKGKFRRLRGIDCTYPVNALHMIESAFTLHNFVLQNDQSDENDSDSDEESGSVVTIESGAAGVNVEFANAALRRAAQRKRDCIAAKL